MENQSKQFSIPRSRRVGAQTTCQCCESTLTSENWTASMQKYKRYICKHCHTKRQKAYQQNTPHLKQRRNDAVKRHLAKMTPEQLAERGWKDYMRQLKRRHGITEEEFNSLLTQQKGRCPICTEALAPKRMHLDHCHASGKVRGVLCPGCNILLGHAKDDTFRLTQAIAYLEKI